MDPELRRALEDLSHGEAKPFNADAITGETPEGALKTDQPQGEKQDDSQQANPDPTKTDNQQTNTGSDNVIEFKDLSAKIKIGTTELTAEDLKNYIDNRTSLESKQAELTQKEKALEDKASQLSSNFEFLDLAAKSKIIAPALQALKNGATEEEVFAMMAAAAGKRVAEPAPSEPAKADPRSVWPPEDIDSGTPEYEQAYVAHLEYKMDQRNDKLRNDLLAEMKKREDAELAKASQAQAAAAARQATLASNQELIRKALVAELPFKIEELTKEQMAEFMAHIADTGKALALPLDEETMQTRAYTEGELRYLALKAYPGDVNPFKLEEPKKPEPPIQDKGLQPGDPSGTGQRTQPSFMPEGYNPDGYKVLLDLKPIN